MEENNFYYIGGNDEIAFDANYLNNLISSEKFEEASDYFRQFESNNALIRAKQKAKIYELDAAARKKKAIYSNLNDEEIADIKLSNVILKKGGIDQLRYEKDEAGNRIYDDKTFAEYNKKAVSFEEAYASLGSSFYDRYSDEYNKEINKRYGEGYIFGYAGSPDIRKNDAVTLKVTIPKNKYGSAVLFGKHPLINKNNYRDEILATLNNINGITIDDLKQSGISIYDEDNGDLTFIYDKNSDYAKALTIAIGKVACNYHNDYNLPQITGYDENGNETTSKKTYSKLSGEYSPDKIPYVSSDAASMREMSYIYGDVNNTKTKAFTKNDNLKRDFSSTSFNLSQIKTDGDKKLITEHVKSMAFADYKHYGFLDSDGGKNTLLQEFDENQFEQFVTQMNGRGLNQIHYQGMVVNGTTGVLITLDPKLDSNGNPIKGSTRMKMFIPNYLNSLTNYDINSSTDLQAMMEYNNMKNYGENYQYKFEDGSKAYIDSFGNIRRVTSNGYNMIDNSSESKQNLIRDIDRDFILKQADMQIGKYMNNKGQYNMEGVRTDAAIIAYNGAEELYPNIPLTTIYGKEITPEDIFDDNRTFMQTADETCNMFVLMKLQEMYNLYDKIIGKVVKKQVK